MWACTRPIVRGSSGGASGPPSTSHGGEPCLTSPHPASCTTLDPQYHARNLTDIGWHTPLAIPHQPLAYLLRAPVYSCYDDIFREQVGSRRFLRPPRGCTGPERLLDPSEQGRLRAYTATLQITAQARSSERRLQQGRDNHQRQVFTPYLSELPSAQFA